MCTLGCFILLRVLILAVRCFLFAVPIVPIIEIFAFVYFSGMYLVWKHQCLHVYAQEFEGGGASTWQNVFGFLMACLYMAQFVFIAFMGIKKGSVQSGLGFVPLIVTGLFHCVVIRKLIAPLRNIALEVAADVDLQDGELPKDVSTGIKQLYRQPALDRDQDERGPKPYRRKAVETASTRKRAV